MQECGIDMHSSCMSMYGIVLQLTMTSPIDASLWYVQTLLSIIFFCRQDPRDISGLCRNVALTEDVLLHAAIVLERCLSSVGSGYPCHVDLGTYPWWIGAKVFKLLSCSLLTAHYSTLSDVKDMFRLCHNTNAWQTDPYSLAPQKRT
jgi:hypothetical protein